MSTTTNNPKQQSPISKLSRAAYNADVDTIIHLIHNCNVNINEARVNGDSMLIYAVTSGKTMETDTINILLRNGADPSIRNMHGENAVMLGSCLRRHDFLECLIHLNMQHIVDINTVDDDGNTALHHAAMGGSMKCAELLLSEWASLDRSVRNDVGLTAAGLARWCCNDQVAELIETFEHTID